MTSLLLAWLLQVWEPPPPPGSSQAQGIRPPHQGFTFGLSLGVGDAFIGSSRGAGGSSGLGLGGLNAMFGWFLSHDIDLALRVDLYNSSVGSFAAYGPVLQYWFGDDFTVIGGIGIGSGNQMDNGFAFIIGASWNAWKPMPGAGNRRVSRRNAGHFGPHRHHHSRRRGLAVLLIAAVL
jgi:hypothetical protein